MAGFILIDLVIASTMMMLTVPLNCHDRLSHLVSSAKVSIGQTLVVVCAHAVHPVMPLQADLPSWKYPGNASVWCWGGRKSSTCNAPRKELWSIDSPQNSIRTVRTFNKVMIVQFYSCNFRSVIKHDQSKQFRSQNKKCSPEEQQGVQELSSA